MIRSIIDRIFPGSVAERLGIERISIAQGSEAFPVATSGAVFGWQTDELGNVGAANAYATTERSLSPDHTGGAQMVISRKSLKQSGEGLEAAIRRDLNAVMSASWTAWLSTVRALLTNLWASCRGRQPTASP